MTPPDFPDPLGLREVNRPGALSSKAGNPIERRVEELESAARHSITQPASTVTNGSVLTADSTQVGLAKWVAGHGTQLAYNAASTPTFTLASPGYPVILQGAALVYWNTNGTHFVVIEYYNGSSWVAVSGLSSDLIEKGVAADAQTFRPTVCASWSGSKQFRLVHSGNNNQTPNLRAFAAPSWTADVAI